MVLLDFVIVVSFSDFGICVASVLQNEFGRVLQFTILFNA